MKIRLISWLNLIMFFICITLAIIKICTGDINGLVVGIFGIIVGIVNLFVFLCSVATWWHDSDFILDKFVFTCPKCGQKQIPNFWEWFFVPHIGSKRYLKCQDPDCRKRSWMRRK